MTLANGVEDHSGLPARARAITCSGGINIVAFAFDLCNYSQPPRAETIRKAGVHHAA